LHLVGWLGVAGASRDMGSKVWATGFAVVSGAAGGCVGYLLADFLDPTAHPERATWLALPITLIIYYLATALFIGLASKKTNDEDREWWARSGAWILMATAAWLLLGGLVIYGPRELHALDSWLVGGGGLGAGWLASLLGANSKTTSGRARRDQSLSAGEEGGGVANWLARYAGKLAPVVFLVCLLLTVAKIANLLVTMKIEPYSAVDSFSAQLARPGGGSDSFADGRPADGSLHHVTLRQHQYFFVARYVSQPVDPGIFGRLEFTPAGESVHRVRPAR
jgi:hypothetical protein